MNKLVISQINIYPVKSLGGISLEEAVIEDRGLRYDRRWMITDENGNFLTQRVFPEMALLKTELLEDQLVISHKIMDLEPLRICIDSYNEEELLSVNVWNDTVQANTVSNEADEWLSKVLKKSCRLVHMPEKTLRKVDAKYAHNNEIVAFADAYPFLIIGEESLADLNGRLEEKVPMNRFRPNFAFSGGEPYEEDNWKRFRAGSTIFNVVKPCSRCVMPTTNQDTAERKAEPLRTLATYRTVKGNVMFGQNLTHDLSNGKIRVGDEIEVLEWK